MDQDKPTIKERRADVSIENSIILHQCQLPTVLHREKTTIDEWIRDGQLRYFRAKPGGTRIFLVEHLVEDMRKMYNTYHHVDVLDVGDM